MKKRVADILIETLATCGITDCFLVAGGGAMHLDNALALCNRIQKYCNHHEQACTMAAEAYARLSGKPAMACVTSGPGASNAITGVLGAYQDSIPLIVISGQIRYDISSMNTSIPLRYRGIQELNIVPMVRGITKYATMITDPLSIRYEAKKAFHIAISGRRGPVWLDIPLDIQSALVEEEELHHDSFSEILHEPPTVDDLNSIYKMLKDAKRPCILGGTGIVSAHAQNGFRMFLDKVRVPVIGGGWCTDLLNTLHPMYFGTTGDIGTRTGNFIIQNADVILVLGNSLSFRQTGYAQETFAPQASIIWVDIDENETKKPGMRYSVFCKSDLNVFFQLYTSMFDIIEVDKKWKDYCDNLAARFTVYESANDAKEWERVNSYLFWKEFDANSPQDILIAMGNSRANAAKIQIGVQHKDQRAITNYLCGSMGYDLPAAIGMAVFSRRCVYCVTGDGSIMMNLQELQTIVHNNLAIKIIVFANDGYEAIRQTCDHFFNGIYLGCDAQSGISFPSFEKIALSFGFEYKCCNTNAEIKEAVQWILSHDGRLFLEVKQKHGNTVSPRLLSRMREDGSFESPSLQDMAPFLESEEMKSLMFSDD